MGPPTHRSRGEDSGFTLLEILFVLFIVGVLTAISAPRYLDYLTKTRLAGHAQFVLETLRLARIEALTREMPVSVCASTSGTSCTGTPWEKGWLVFSDEGLPGTIDGNDVVLRSVRAYEGGVTLDVTITEGSVDYFQFKPEQIVVVELDRRDIGKGHGFAQLASDLVGDTALALLGIGDAFAKKPKKDRRREKYKQMCAKPGAENNPHCKTPLAVLELCSDNHTGETGTAVRSIPTGEAVTEEIDCE